MTYSVPEPDDEMPDAPGDDAKRVSEATDDSETVADREVDQNQTVIGGATGSGAADEPRDDGDTTHTTGPGPTSVDDDGRGGSDAGRV